MKQQKKRLTGAYLRTKERAEALGMTVTPSWKGKNGHWHYHLSDGKTGTILPKAYLHQVNHWLDGYEYALETARTDEKQGVSRADLVKMLLRIGFEQVLKDAGASEMLLEEMLFVHGRKK